MADTVYDVGAVMPLLVGEYSSSVEYEQNNIVTYNYSTYWHYSATPTTNIPPTNTSYWKIITDASIVSNAASSALSSKRDAEAWAIGTRDGVVVTDSDATFENNAKYYAEYAAAVIAAVAAEGQAF